MNEKKRLNKIITDSVCLSITTEMLKNDYIPKSKSEKMFLEIAKKMINKEKAN